MTQIVYFAQRADGDIKIGTTSHFVQRMRTLVFTSRSGLQVLGIIPGGTSREKDMHERFAAYRRPSRTSTPKRLRFSEWFAPAPELLWFITFETQPAPATHFRRAGAKERVFVADAPRRWHKGEDGNYCPPTTNEVQRRLYERFGSLDTINYVQLAKETGIMHGRIGMWLEGWIETCEMVTVRKWAAYLNCTPDDLLAHAGKGAPEGTPAPAKRHERGWRTPKEKTA